MTFDKRQNITTGDRIFARMGGLLVEGSGSADTYSDYWVNRCSGALGITRRAQADHPVAGEACPRRRPSARHRDLAPNAAQTLTNKTVQESIYAKLRDTAPGEEHVLLDPQGRIPVEDKKAAMMEQMAQAKEKVEADSRRVWPTRWG